jgi:hypothetical protein
MGGVSFQVWVEGFLEVKGCGVRRKFGTGSIMTPQWTHQIRFQMAVCMEKLPFWGNSLFQVDEEGLRVIQTKRWNRTWKVHVGVLVEFSECPKTHYRQK